MKQWTVYLDESGVFGEPGKHAIVGGLLVPSPHKPLLRWRSVIEGIYAHVNYPPHSSHLRNVVGHLMAWRRSRQASEGEPERWRRFHETSWSSFAQAWKTVARVAAPLAEAVEKPGVSQRELYDLRVTWQPTVLATLPVATRKELEGLEERCANLMRKFLGWTADSHSGTVLLLAYVPPGAGTAPPSSQGAAGGGASAPAAAEPGREPYLDAVEAVFERVVALLRTAGSGERQSVEVQWATRPHMLLNRHVHDGDLEARAERALSYPARVGQGRGSSIHFEIMNGLNYDAKVPAGIVLADFVCNRLYRCVPTCARAMELEGRVRQFAGLPARRSAMSLAAGPLLVPAAEGTSRAVVRDVFGGLAPARAPSDLRPGWVRDMTREWVAAAAQPGTAGEP